MKKNYLIALSMIACFTAFSQEEIKPTLRNSGASGTSPSPTTVQPISTSTKVISKSKTVTISKRAGEPQRVHDAAYYQQEIAVIDNNLSAIDQKVAFVNGNPQEKLEAESNGWFQQMEGIKTQLNTKKTDLQEKLAKL
ncbi:MAG: hypothetical protein HRT57_05340 [Crocinitomicaceae bacterium]|nr:hypothetical protein [Crocinitomicaceae bacterium]